MIFHISILAEHVLYHQVQQNLHLPDDIACCFEALSASGITNMAANNLTYRRASLVLRFDSFLVASGQHCEVLRSDTPAPVPWFALSVGAQCRLKSCYFQSRVGVF